MGLLPGQTLSANGVSSYIAGTNMSPDYGPRTSRNTPQIQSLIKQAGFTLIRCAIPAGSADSYIDLTAQACSNMGCAMLTILNHADLAWNQHLVSCLGARCNLYEFSNEPDLNNLSWSQYLGFWNQHVPVLRQTNKNAAFIGPVLGVFANLDTYLVPWLAGCKASGVLPDCVSYHIYPCTGSQWTASTCMPRATAFVSAAQKVTAAVTGVLGRTLPQALTEWNIDAGNPVASFAKDPAFVPQWTKQAIDSMVQANLAIACQWDAGAGAGGGDDDLISVSNFQPNPNGQFQAMSERIAFYLGGGVPNPPSPPPVTPPPSGASFYLAAAPSNVLPTANQLYPVANAGTPPNTWVYNRIGTALGFGELTSQGSTSPWPALASIGAPTGRGFLCDVSLAGQMIPSGTWGGNIRLNCAINGNSAPQQGSLIADITGRTFKYNQASETYFPLTTFTLARVTIPPNYTTFPLPAVQVPDVIFDANEYLYLDYWPNIVSNSANNPLLDIRLNRESTDTSGKTGDVNAMIMMPALQPVAVPPSPPVATTFTHSAMAGPYQVTPALTAFNHGLGVVPDMVIPVMQLPTDGTSANTCYVDFASMTSSQVSLQSASDATVYILSIKF